MKAQGSRTALRIGSIAALAAFAASAAHATDWPAFKPGQWSFERTMAGTGRVAEKVSTTECTDPTADQQSQRAMLGKAGCKFTPLTQSGKTYRYSATCAMAGMKSESDSVLEVESAESYTVTMDSVVNGEKSHEVLRARRIGDCAK